MDRETLYKADEFVRRIEILKHQINSMLKPLLGINQDELDEKLYNGYGLRIMVEDIPRMIKKNEEMICRLEKVLESL